MTQYIFVTGGVVSSLGKGLTSAAIGSLLESHGLAVSCVQRCPVGLRLGLLDARPALNVPRPGCCLRRQPNFRGGP